MGSGISQSWIDIWMNRCCDNRWQMPCVAFDVAYRREYGHDHAIRALMRL
jgi:hypothetical protein